MHRGLLLGDLLAPNITLLTFPPSLFPKKGQTELSEATLKNLQVRRVPVSLIHFLLLATFSEEVNSSLTQPNRVKHMLNLDASKMRDKYFPLPHLSIFLWLSKTKTVFYKQLNSTVGVEKKTKNTALPQLEGTLKPAGLLLPYYTRLKHLKDVDYWVFLKYLSHLFKMKWISNPTPLIIFEFNNHIYFLEHHRNQLLPLDNSQY